MLRKRQNMPIYMKFVHLFFYLIMPLIFTNVLL